LKDETHKQQQELINQREKVERAMRARQMAKDRERNDLQRQLQQINNNLTRLKMNIANAKKKY